MNRRNVGVVVLALLLAGAAGVWTWLHPAIAPASPGRPRARRVTLAGVANFAEVAPGIYRGAQPTAEGYAALARLGVRTVINLRVQHPEHDAVLAAHLSPLELPLEAGLHGAIPPTPDEVARFLGWLDDPKLRPVFFHCALGEDRTGALCAVYRLEECGWTRDEALAEMHEFGFNRVWVGLEEWVGGYTPGSRLPSPGPTGQTPAPR